MIHSISHLKPFSVVVFCLTCDGQNGFINLRVIGYNLLLLFWFSKTWYYVTTSLLEFPEVKVYVLLAFLSTLTKLRNFVENADFLTCAPGLGTKGLDAQKVG